MAAIDVGQRRSRLAPGQVISTCATTTILLLLMPVLLALVPATCLALDNGLARTPPMGWLAWERFTCQIDCKQYPNECINANLFRQMADRLAQDGWLELGYNYVHIDDCWSELSRDETNNRLVADKQRFPAGIRALADHVHRHDSLKLGIYGDCGTSTCAGYPAQLKYNDTLKALYKPLFESQLDDIQSSLLINDDESDDDDDQDDDENGDNNLNDSSETTAAAHKATPTAIDEDYIIGESTYFGLDAQTLAEWQIDSLKFDGCHIDPLRAQTICSKMAPALRASKRPILLICEWPFYMMYAHAEPDFKLAASSCNVWRYYDDIEDSWLSILNTIDYTVKHQSTILKYHGPGHWFDPDQLVIGNFGLSVAQARAQMALWSVWAAPLYMSNDLRSIRPEFVNILKNKQLIGVNQDELGVFGQMVKQSIDGMTQAFIKPVLPIRNNCPSFAIVYLNRNTRGNKQKVSFKLADLILAAPIRQAATNQAAVLAYKASQKKKKEEEEEETKNDMEKSATFQEPDAGAAANNHRQVDDESFELGHLFSNNVDQEGGQSNGGDQDELSAGQQLVDQTSDSEEVIDGGDDDDGLIVASECLKRLSKAAELAASEAGQTKADGRHQAAIEYKLVDLFGDDEPILGSARNARRSIGDDLTLLVSPSGVRAVKLIEIVSDHQ